MGCEIKETANGVKKEIKEVAATLNLTIRKLCKDLPSTLSTPVTPSSTVTSPGYTPPYNKWRSSRKHNNQFRTDNRSTFPRQEKLDFHNMERRENPRENDEHWSNKRSADTSNYNYWDPLEDFHKRYGGEPRLEDANNSCIPEKRRIDLF